MFVYLLTNSLVHLTPLKTIVISTKDGCPTLLANDGYFGQACTLFYFYSCLFCKFKLIKGANKVVDENKSIKIFIAYVKKTLLLLAWKWNHSYIPNISRLRVVALSFIPSSETANKPRGKNGYIRERLAPRILDGFFDRGSVLRVEHEGRSERRTARSS